MSTKQDLDWEAIERDYRAGLLSLREIGEKHGCTEGAIRKRAKKESWARDLAAKIQQKADDLVRKAEVRAEVRSTQIASEREVVEANAAAIVNIRLGHRTDIRSSRELALKMLNELEALTDNRELFSSLGEMLADPGEKGVDKLNELYRKVIDLPQRIKGIKELSDTLKTLIGLEREAWGLAQVVDKPPEPEQIDPMETARRIAFMLASANHQITQGQPHG